MNRPIRIANFSGAFADYELALHDAVHGDPVDVVMGDYLAELTFGMITEAFIQSPDPSAQHDFYFDIFLRQLDPELAAIAAKGIKVVVNAGAYNPDGLAAQVREAVAAKGLDLKVASINGDNLLPRVQELAGNGQLQNLDTGRPMGNLSGRITGANAYLGGWGIAAALEGGADIVIAGRVTDASLTVGPAAWWHGWKQDDFDAIAGAIAAGHLIECGPQANGGNYSGFQELGDIVRMGFPIAEIERDGSFVITKQSAGAGLVTPDTVKAQLLYETQGQRYLNPDAVLHIDSLSIEQAGPGRVRVSAVRGSPPPPTTKVACYYHDGWRLVMFMYVTGLDWREKVEFTRRQLVSLTETLDLDEFAFDPLGQPVDAPRSQAEATMVIRIAAAAEEKTEIEALMNSMGSFALGGIPGYTFEFTRQIVPRVEYWPGLVEQRECEHRVTLEDGSTITIPTPMTDPDGANSGAPATSSPADPGSWGPTRKVPLGTVIHARSGDKGADASLGVWCKRPEATEWLLAVLTADKVHFLLGARDDVRVDAYPLPNIDGQLFVLRGWFGRSGTGNIGLDQIGKGLGEFLRACITDVPVRFLEETAQEPLISHSV